MYDQTGECNCISSIFTDIYEASSGSLPDVHNVNSEIFKNSVNSSAINLNKQEPQNTFDTDDSYATPESYVETKKIFREIQNKKSNKSLWKNDRDSAHCQNEFNHDYEDNNGMNQLENIFDVIDERNIVENNYWDGSTVSGEEKKYGSTVHKSYNNSVKIKVTFNSENLKNNKRKTNNIPESCILKIQLSGNTKSRMRITNNKQIQVNSATANRHQSENGIEMIDYNETKTVSTYSNTNDDGNDNQKLFEGSKINEKSVWPPKEYGNFGRNQGPENSKLHCDSNVKHSNRGKNNTKRISKTLYDSKPFRCFSDSKLDIFAESNDFIGKNKLFNLKQSENHMKDKFVQTFTQKIIDNKNLSEDQDLIKLGMWLEIINNSEYNVYNQDFRVSTQNRRKKTSDSRILENERNFRAFLKEIGQLSDSDDEHNSVKPFNQNENCLKNQIHKQSCFDGIKLKKCSKICPTRKHSSRKKMIDTHDFSMESIEISENSQNSNSSDHKHFGKYIRNAFIFQGNPLKKQFSTNTESSIKHFLQHLFSRMAPNTSNKERQKFPSKQEKSNFFSYFTFIQPSKAANIIWNKINPLKFYSLKDRQKPFTKIFEERKKPNNEWDYHSNNFLFNFRSDKDAKHCKTQNDQKSNFYNKCFTEQFDCFTNCPLNFGVPSYPYDTMPFMQCSEGCDLCDPDFNKAPNINASYY